MKNASAYCVSQHREDWRRARAAHADLLLMGMPRVNLLVTGMTGVLSNVLDTLVPDLNEPIVRWRSGEKLVLPPVPRARTMILEDVGALTHDDQVRLLKWLDGAAGRTQVVSTSSVSLLPDVESGAFIDTLYYRLNIVSLDVTS
jgi:hypothetical protein